VGYCYTIRVNTFFVSIEFDVFGQLSSSGFGSLNGRGFDLFFDAGGSDFLGLGMGSGLGLGWCRHTASPTTSFIRIAPTCCDGVMQNHQPKCVSTWPQDFAR
jgi:hypothetical protein